MHMSGCRCNFGRVRYEKYCEGEEEPLLWYDGVGFLVLAKYQLNKKYELSTNKTKISFECWTVFIGAENV